MTKNASIAKKLCKHLNLINIPTIYENGNCWTKFECLRRSQNLYFFSPRFLKNLIFNANLPPKHDENFYWQYQLRIYYILLVFLNSFGNIESHTPFFRFQSFKDPMTENEKRYRHQGKMKLVGNILASK